MREDRFIKKVGNNIKKQREIIGLTQEDVDSHGVSYKHLQKIEAGRTNTTLRMLYRLAKALDCKVRDFFNSE